MDFDKATDKALADEAQTGLRGQGAVVEMMRRLKDSVDKLNQSTTKLNRRLLWVTVAILILTIIQIFIQFKK